MKKLIHIATAICAVVCLWMGNFSMRVCRSEELSKKEFIHVWEEGKDGCSKRFAHTAVWNAKGGNFIIFGGQFIKSPKESTFYNDVWTYNPKDKEWKEIKGKGQGPDGRLHHAAAFNANENAMYVFGGLNSKWKPFDDFWKFDVAEEKWEQIKTQGKSPNARFHGVMFYLNDSDSLLLFGGAKGYGKGEGLGDLWLFDCKKREWSLKNEKGPFLWQFAAAFDETSGNLFIHGGYNEELARENKTRIYDLKENKWTDAGIGLYETSGHKGVFFENRFLTFGGAKVNVKEGYDSLNSFDTVAKTWSKVEAKGKSPGTTAHCAFCWAPELKSIFVFGGTQNQFFDPAKETKVWMLKIGENQK